MFSFFSPPRHAYRPRSRSPRRDDRLDSYTTRTWRRRSPSPRPMAAGGKSAGGSGKDSITSSRLSSPRPFARPSDPYPDDHPRAMSGTFRSPRHRSPPQRDGFNARSHSPYDEPPYPSHSRSTTLPEETSADGTAYSRPQGDYRERGIPTGPANSFRETHISSPIGQSAPVSVSAHNRVGDAYQSSTSGYSGRGGFRGRGGLPDLRRDHLARDSGPPSAPRRGTSSGWGGTPSYGRGGQLREPYHRDLYYDPRGLSSARTFTHAPGGRGGSSTSLTTPRTQRFNTALQDITKVKDGGEKLPSFQDTSKADKLEEEAARLRKLIDEREMKKRQGLREWERLERENSSSALRTELAEEQLKSMNGEDGLSAAAF